MEYKYNLDPQKKQVKNKNSKIAYSILIVVFILIMSFVVFVTENSIKNASASQDVINISDYEHSRILKAPDLFGAYSYTWNIKDNETGEYFPIVGEISDKLILSTSIYEKMKENQNEINIELNIYNNQDENILSKEFLIQMNSEFFDDLEEYKESSNNLEGALEEQEGEQVLSEDGLSSLENGVLSNEQIDEASFGETEQQFYYTILAEYQSLEDASKYETFYITKKAKLNTAFPSQDEQEYLKNGADIIDQVTQTTRYGAGWTISKFQTKFVLNINQPGEGQSVAGKGVVATVTLNRSYGILSFKDDSMSDIDNMPDKVFIRNGESYSTIDSWYRGEGIFLPNSPSRKGYVFSGWGRVDGDTIVPMPTDNWASLKASGKNTEYLTLWTRDSNPYTRVTLSYWGEKVDSDDPNDTNNYEYLIERYDNIDRSIFDDGPAHIYELPRDSSKKITEPQKYREYPQKRISDDDPVAVDSEVETVNNSADTKNPDGYKYDDLFEYVRYEDNVVILDNDETVVKIYLKRKTLTVNFYSAEPRTPTTLIWSINARWDLNIVDQYHEVCRLADGNDYCYWAPDNDTTRLTAYLRNMPKYNIDYIYAGPNIMSNETPIRYYIQNIDQPAVIPNPDDEHFKLPIDDEKYKSGDNPPYWDYWTLLKSINVKMLWTTIDEYIPLLGFTTPNPGVYGPNVLKDTDDPTPPISRDLNDPWFFNIYEGPTIKVGLKDPHGFSYYYIRNTNNLYLHNLHGVNDIVPGESYQYHYDGCVNVGCAYGKGEDVGVQYEKPIGSFKFIADEKSEYTKGEYENSGATGIKEGETLAEYTNSDRLKAPSYLDNNTVEFEGWYTDSGFDPKSKVDLDTWEMPNREIDLYAHWVTTTKQHPVRFNTLNWENDPPTEIVGEPKEAYYKQLIDQSYIPDVGTHPGYTWTSWYYYKSAEDKEAGFKTWFAPEQMTMPLIDYDEYPVDGQTPVMTLHQEWAENKLVDYEFKFELEDGTPVADPVFGRENAGETVTYDVNEKPITEFYKKYADFLVLKEGEEPEWEITLDYDEDENTHTFVFEIKDAVAYDVNFYLKDSLIKVADTETYYAHDGDKVSYNAKEKLAFDFYEEYRDRITLASDCEPTKEITVRYGLDNHIDFYYIEPDTSHYEIRFCLEKGDRVADDIVSEEVDVGTTVSYNAQSNPPDFYEEYQGGKIRLSKGDELSFIVKADPDANIYTVYYTYTTPTSYTISFKLKSNDDEVAPPITEEGYVGQVVNYNVNEKQYHEFYENYWGMLRAEEPYVWEHDLTQNSEENTHTFYFTYKTIANYKFQFHLMDGTKIADDAEDIAYVGDMVTYNAVNDKPELYKKFVDRVDIDNPDPISISLPISDDETQNVGVFYYGLTEKRYKYEFRFALEDGSYVAPPVAGEDFIGEEQNYNLDENPPQMYDEYKDKVHFSGDKTDVTIEINEDESKNIYTFTYEKNLNMVEYAFSFEDENGIKLAPDVTGVDAVGTSIQYIATNKPSTDFYPGFYDKIDGVTPEKYNEQLNADKSQNHWTFVYTLNSSESVFYTWNFKLKSEDSETPIEDLPDVAPQLKYLGNPEDTVSFDALSLKLSDFNETYAGKVILLGKDEGQDNPITYTLSNTESENNKTFYYKLRENYAQYTWKFILKNSETEVARPISGFGEVDSSVYYDAAEKSQDDFYPTYQGKLELQDPTDKKLEIKQNPEENIYCFEYVWPTKYEWHFALEDGTEIAPPIINDGSVDSTVSYDAGTNPPNFYSGISESHVTLQDPKSYEYQLAPDPRTNVRTFVYKLNNPDNKTYYEWHFELSDGHVVAPVIRGFGEPNQEVSYYADSKPESDFYEIYRGKIQLSSESQPQYTIDLSPINEASKNIHTFVYDYIDDNTSYEFHFELEDGTKVAEPVVGVGKIATYSPEYDAEAKPESDFLPEFRGKIILSSTPWQYAIPLKYDSSKNIHTFVYQLKTNVVKYSFNFKMNDVNAVDVADPIDGYGYVDDIVSYDASKKSSSDFYPGFASKIELSDSEQTEKTITLSATEPNTESFFYKWKEGIGEQTTYEITFKLVNGTEVAPTIKGCGDVGESIVYDSTTKPISDFYPNYRGNIDNISEHPTQTIELQNDPSANVAEFIYMFKPVSVDYEWRFELEDGTIVADPVHGIGNVGEEVSYNTEMNTPVFRQGLSTDNLEFLGQSSIATMTLRSSFSQNIYVFKYKFKEGFDLAHYEWHFELVNGWAVAPTIDGFAAVGSQITYDTTNTPPKIYDVYQDKVQILEDAYKSYTMSIAPAGHESANIYTFVYEFIETDIAYQFRFELEDGTEIAPPISGVGTIGTYTSEYNAEDKSEDDFYAEYAGKVDLLTPKKGSIRLKKDSNDNVFTFKYKLKPIYVSYEFDFRLNSETGIEVAPAVKGVGRIFDTITYDASKKSPSEFFKNYEKCLDLQYPQSLTIELQQNADENIYSFIYKQSLEEYVSYEWRFVLDEEDSSFINSDISDIEVAPPVRGMDKVGTDVYYNAKTKLALEFYKEYAGEVLLRSEPPEIYPTEITYTLSDKEPNVKTFKYQLISKPTTCKWCFELENGVKVAPDIFEPEHEVGETVSYDASKKDQADFYEGFYSAVMLQNPPFYEYELDNDASANVRTFKYKFISDNYATYEWRFETADGKTVANSEIGAATVGSSVSRNAFSQPPVFLEGYEDKVELVDTSEKSINMTNDASQNVYTFIYKFKQDQNLVGYQWRFETEDGYVVADPVTGAGIIGTQVNYDALNKPIEEFYPAYAGNIQLVGDNQHSMELDSDESLNVYTFKYIIPSISVHYEWHFTLEDGTEVAPVIEGAGVIGSTITYDASTKKAIEFFPGFYDSITLKDTKTIDMLLDADKTKNIGTFIYQKNASTAYYEWHFTLENGIAVAPTIKSLATVNSNVAYDAKVKSPSDFFEGFRDNIELIDVDPITMKVDSDESKNIRTFKYKLKNSSVSYEWHFVLEDGRQIADTYYGSGTAGTTVSYNAEGKSLSDFYEGYAGKVTLVSLGHQEMKLDSDSAKNIGTFVYKKNEGTVSYQWQFTLEDGTPVADPYIGLGNAFEKVSYWASSKSINDFYPGFAGNIILDDEDIKSMVLDQDETKNIRTFKYKLKPGQVEYEWRFVLQNGDAVALPYRGVGTINTTIFYDASNKPLSDFYEGYAGKVELADSSAQTMELKSDKQQNVRTFVYKWKSDQVSYEWHFQTQDGQEVAPPYVSAGTIGDDVSYYATGKSLSDFYSEYAGKIELIDGEQDYKTMHLQSDSSKNIGVFLYKIIDDNYRYEWHFTLADGTPVADKIVGYGVENSVVSYDAENKPLQDFYESFAGNITLKDPYSQRIEINADATKNIRTFIYDRNSGYVEYKWNFTLADGTKIADTITKQGIVGNTVFYNAELKPYNEFYSDYANNVTLREPKIQSIILDNEPTKNVWTFVYDIASGSTEYTWYFALDDGTQVAPPISGAGTVGQKINMDASTKTKPSDFYPGYYGKIELQKPFIHEITLDTDKSKNTFTFIYSRKTTDTVKYQWNFTLADGTKVADSINGIGTKGDEISYDVSNKPLSEYYSSFVGKLKLPQNTSHTIILNSDESENVYTFVYDKADKQVMYCISFTLEDGTSVADDIKGLGEVGTHVFYDAFNKPRYEFYEGFADYIQLKNQSYCEIVLDIDPHKNVYTFIYKLRGIASAYEWHFALEDGTQVAPPIKGLEKNGTTISYDANNKPLVDFYEGFRSNIELISTQSISMKIEADPTKNIRTFYYKLKTTDNFVKYEWRFALEDGTQVADTYYGAGIVDTYVSYNAEIKSLSDFYGEYVGNITLNEPKRQIMLLDADPTKNVYTFIYTKNISNYSYRWEFILDDGTPVANPFVGVAPKDSEVSYYAAGKNIADFYPGFAGKIELDDDGYKTMRISDIESNNIKTFKYKFIDAKDVIYEWRFVMQNGDMVADTYVGCAKQGTEVSYDASNKPVSDFYLGYAGKIELVDSSTQTMILQQDRQQNIRTFVYKWKSNQVSYEWHFQTEDGQEVAPPYISAGTIGSTVSYYAAGKSVSDFYSEYAGKVELLDGEDVYKTLVLQSDSSKNTGVFLYKAIDNHYRYEWHFTLEDGTPVADKIVGYGAQNSKVSYNAENKPLQDFYASFAKNIKLVTDPSSQEITISNDVTKNIFTFIYSKKTSDTVKYQWNFALADGTKVADSVVGLGEVGQSVSYDASAKQFTDFYSDYADHIVLKEPFSKSYSLNKDESKNVWTFVYDLDEDSTGYTWYFALDDGTQVAPPISGSGIVGETIHMDALSKNKPSDFYPGYYGKVELNAPYSHDIVLNQDKSKNTYTFIYSKKTSSVVKYQWNFTLADGTKVADSIVSFGTVGTSISYDASNKPLSDFYSAYAGKILLTEPFSYDYKLDSNESNNIRTFVYEISDSAFVKYEWRFALENGEMIADTICGYGVEGETVSYDATNKPVSDFYNGMWDKVELQDSKSYSYNLNSDDSKNIYTFTYKLKLGQVKYEWRFALEDGTEIAYPVKGFGVVGETVSYDATNKPLADFYSGYAGKVMLSGLPYQYMELDSNEMNNVRTFTYKQNGVNLVSYEWHFELEDGTEVAKPVSGIGNVGSSVSYDATNKARYDFYPAYAKYVELQPPRTITIDELSSDKTLNVRTFKYKFSTEQKYVEYQWNFQLEDGRQVADSIFGVGIIGDSVYYDASSKPLTDFYKEYANNINLKGDSSIKMELKDDKSLNSRTFIYTEKESHVKYEWHFELQDGTEVAPAVIGEGLVNTTIVYNAKNKPISDFYSGFVNTVELVDESPIEMTLSSSASDNSRTFIYKYKDNYVRYQWQFELNDGTLVAPTIFGSGKIGSTVSYNATNKPLSEFYPGFAQNILLNEPASYSYELTTDDNIKVFKYSINTEDTVKYEWHFELQDGTEVAEPIFGAGKVGDSVSYDAINKLPSEFYSGFVGKINLLSDSPQTITLSNLDGADNSFTFEYELLNNYSSYEWRFQLSDGTTVADSILGTAQVGSKVSYNALNKPLSEFYSDYAGKVALDDTESRKEITIQNNPENNIKTFVYKIKDEVNYTWKFELEGGVKVADDIGASAPAGEYVAYDASTTIPKFYDAFEGKVILQEPVFIRYALQDDEDKNVRTFIYKLQSDYALCEWDFKLVNGNDVAPAIITPEIINSTIQYNAETNPPDFYSEYAGKILLLEPYSISYEVSSNESLNIKEFTYALSSDYATYEWRFELENGKSVAEPIKDFGKIGTEISLDVTDKTDFYPSYAGSIDLISSAIGRMIVDEDESKNIYTFKYKIKESNVAYEWHFELENGTPVADPIYGADYVNNTVYYNAAEKDIDDFYSNFKGIVSLKTSPSIASITLDEDATANKFTFIYTLPENYFSYEWHFTLEDGTVVADPYIGYAIENSDVIYDASTKPITDFYPQYIGKLTLVSSPQIEIHVHSDPSKNTATFIYKLDVDNVGYEIHFELEDGTEVADTIYDVGEIGDTVQYDASNKPSREFKSDYYGKVALVSNSIQEIVLGNKASDNKMTFIYKPKIGYAKYEWHFALDNGNEVAPVISGVAQVGQSISYDSINKPLSEFYPGYAGKVMLKDSSLHKLDMTISDIESNNIMVFEYILGLDLVEYKWNFKININGDSFDVAPQIFGVGHVSDQVSYDASNKPLSDFFSSYANKVEISGDSNYEYTLSAISSENVRTFNYVAKDDFVEFKWCFELNDGTTIADPVGGVDAVGSEVKYDASRKSINDFYDEYKYKVSLDGDAIQTIKLVSDTSKNIAIFKYKEEVKMAHYEWRFELEDGTEVAPKVEGEDAVNRVVDYNAEIKGESEFYDGFIGKITLQDPKQYSMRLSEYESSNVYTFKYKKNSESYVSYKWNFELEDGTKVADSKTGLGTIGDNVSYDASQKPSTDFYSQFVGNIDLLDPTSYTYELQSDENLNKYTFKYKTKASKVSYEWQFTLEDGTKVADSITGLGTVGESISYDASNKTDFYSSYSGKIKLKSAATQSMELSSDSSQNIKAFIYEPKENAVAYEWHFELEDGTKIADSVKGIGIVDATIEYDASRKPASEFYDGYAGKVVLLDPKYQTMTLDQNPQNNIKVFKYELNEDYVLYKWKFQLQDGTEVAEPISGAGLIGGEVSYNAATKPASEFKKEYAGKVIIVGETQKSIKLQEDETKNIEVFTYKLMDISVSYEWHFALNDGTEVASPISNSGLVGSVVSYDASTKPSSDFYTKYQGKVQLTSSSTHSMTLVIDASQNRYTFVYKLTETPQPTPTPVVDPSTPSSGGSSSEIIGKSGTAYPSTKTIDAIGCICLFLLIIAGAIAWAIARYYRNLKKESIPVGNHVAATC